MSGSTKKPNFFNVVKKRIKLVWKGSRMQGSVVAHPIDFYKTLEKGRKMSSNKGRKKTKGTSVGTSVRLRVVNGPELNIVFLGIPFLIDCAVSTAKLERKRKKEKRKNKLRLTKNNGSTVAQDPLPRAPYSDKFARIRDELVGLGMSEAGATMIASGEIGEDPVEDYLEEHDLGVLAAWLQLDTQGENEQDENELEEALSDG